MLIHRERRIFGIIGRSGSGKTHLISHLIPFFCKKGLRVSTIKHTHHGVDMDTPGKDTFQHRENGAVEVMLATPARWFLQHQSTCPPTLGELIQAMQPVDLILVEGFHEHVPACMEVWRPVTGKEPLYPYMSGIKAIATDSPTLHESLQEKVVFPMTDVESIAHYIQEHAFLWTSAD
ncbi:molybdopterin-guanine dinucleotide biosynthesis protein B [Acetobacter okinawensis]|uniref:molybdopterin-guanine dinucleotide biosynthesis protein B n=1 Tax=Acetobacter okinawensis TaxID=1076594 RepID=UPI001BA56392|nr:molybdopterin-guanine dinucleotide biosynthesis protein B [Acetobacter okinawensis]MBS0964666.1 molybdopterin-guanine dinucleotide biosynthesis protein B [Acetobacter okinawensis]MBS0987180.1 molybdopterin-guanine dinucleotide biosynthesis protein B [Acetobacter okinawensis]